MTIKKLLARLKNLNKKIDALSEERAGIIAELVVELAKRSRS